MKTRMLLDNLVNTILVGSAHLECPPVAAVYGVALERDRFLTILKRMAFAIAEGEEGETAETLANRISDFAPTFYAAVALGNLLDGVEATT